MNGTCRGLMLFPKFPTTSNGHCVLACSRVPVTGLFTFLLCSGQVGSALAPFLLLSSYNNPCMWGSCLLTSIVRMRLLLYEVIISSPWGNSGQASDDVAALQDAQVNWGSVFYLQQQEELVLIHSPGGESHLMRSPLHSKVFFT